MSMIGDDMLEDGSSLVEVLPIECGMHFVHRGMNNLFPTILALPLQATLFEK